MTRPVVFIGPSGHGLPAEAFDGIDIRTPARRGDILRAFHDGARRIGLIDGVFEGAPAVAHKEILAAIAGGATVLGAASMGALRAAECAAFGMVGIGGVYRDYASGRRTADADVAVLHAPAELGFRPLGVALVDAEATMAACLAAGAISGAQARKLLATARALHFKARTWRATIEKAGFRASAARHVGEAVVAHARSVKAEDAKALLAAIADREVGASPAPIVPEAFAHTTLLAPPERNDA